VKRRRILFVESGFGAVGGSVISMLTLLRSLPETPYEGVVLLFDRSLRHRDIEAVAAKVIVWEDPGVLDQDREAQRLTEMLRGRSNPGRRAWPYRTAASLVRLAAQEVPLAVRFGGLARDLQADLVHANDRVHSNLFAILGGRLAGLPVVVHERLIYGYTQADRIASRLVAALCCISTAVKDSAAREGARPGRMLVVDNPVEPIIDRIPRQVVQRVTFIGRLVPWKGVAEFVEACALVARTHPRLEFSVVGGGMGPADPYEAALHRRSRELGLGERLIFTGPVQDIGPIIQATDVLVHASVTPEPFGRTVAEGMVHGLPVVATRAGGPVEMIEPGVTGLLVDPGSPAALAEAIGWLADHPVEAALIGSRAREVAMRRFAPAVHARRMAAIYDAVLGLSEWPA
jgi:glycosyltransferase involved in cell wall biosynthesis